MIMDRRTPGHRVVRELLGGVAIEDDLVGVTYDKQYVCNF